MYRSFSLSTFAGFMSLVASSAAFAQAAPSSALNDVAIDAKTQETFVLSQKNNARGEIILVTGGDSASAKILSISNQELADAKFEIELNRSGSLAYLISEKGSWRVGGFKKTDAGWQKLPESDGVSGEGEASNLAQLPDGKLVLTVLRSGASSPEAVLIEADQKFAVLERIEAQPKSGLTKALDNALPQPGVVASVASDQKESARGNGYGLTAGMLSGLGLSYQRTFSDRNAVRMAGIAWGAGDQVFTNVGVDYLQTIHEAGWARLYWLAGASVYYNRNRQYSYPTGPVCGDPVKPETCTYPQPTPNGWTSSTLYNFGAGLGIEAKAGPVGIALELPLSVSIRGDKSGMKFDSLYPIPTLSVIYHVPARKRR